MRKWLTRRSEAVRAVAATSLVFSVALGVLAFRARRLPPAPIVIHPMTPLPAATRSSTETPGPIKVYVSGAVASPGVYALSWDSRVEQAIAAAGNATDDADLVRVNLAQRVYDEQQIYVPHKAEEATPVLPTLAPAVSPTAFTVAPGHRININTASASELETLSGIGPVLAQRIVDYREANGPFARPEDVKKVKGIGDSVFQRNQDFITTE